MHGAKLRTEWIPSHGKKKNWKPSINDFGGTKEWRNANDTADNLAKRAVKETARGMRADYFVDQLAAKVKRARTLLRRLFIASTTYVLDNDNFKKTFGHWVNRDKRARYRD